MFLIPIRKWFSIKLNRIISSDWAYNTQNKSPIAMLALYK